MYQAILFDIGGVLVEWKPRDYLMERFTNAAVENKVYNITFGSREWGLLDAGRLARYEANQIMLAKADKENCRFEVQEVLDDWESILKPRYRVVELAQRLQKKGYQVFYLSNIAADTLDYVQRLGVLDGFDGGVASCEVHCCKPEPGIYTALLEKYGLPAQECIFIDDSDANVHAAYELGITSIALHRSVNALQRNLRSCGVNTR